jgi:hypothetical protein
LGDLGGIVPTVVRRARPLTRAERPWWSRGLDKIGLGLHDSHARVCMTEPRSPEQADTQVDELMGAVGRMLTR